MQIRIGKIENVTRLGNVTFLLNVRLPEIASEIKPGQFCNIKVSETSFPLLRRPFSIADVNGEIITFMIDLVGEGTKILSQKQSGEEIDILGPLGKGFNLEVDYDTAVFVAGGIGIAPFPYLHKNLLNLKNILVYSGFRNKEHLINYSFDKMKVATDDGSLGYHGNVIQLLEEDLDDLKSCKPKFFGCGPTPMLRALQEFCKRNDFLGEISTESAMACGFGICQGCPVETTSEGYYKLICKDGPVFDIRDVKL